MTREIVEWDLVNMINDLVSMKDNLLTSRATVNFSRRSLLHVVSQSLNATSMAYNLYFFPSPVCHKDGELFTTNNETHKYGTHQLHNLHHPPAILKKYQTGVFYMGVKIYNSLPTNIKKGV